MARMSSKVESIESQLSTVQTSMHIKMREVYEVSWKGNIKGEAFNVFFPQIWVLRVLSLIILFYLKGITKTWFSKGTNDSQMWSQSYQIIS